MKVCFFTTQHIGDNLFSQPFVLHICRSNPDLQFYYWFFAGHILYSNINNLNNLENDKPNVYNRILTPGEPPEDIINADNYIKQMFMINSAKTLFTFEYNNNKYIAFNIWCTALLSPEINFNSLYTGVIHKINELNTKFNVNIKFDYMEKTNYMPKLIDVSIDKFIEWNNSMYNKVVNIETNTERKYIFIYNYKPRSVTVNYDINDCINKLCRIFPDLIFIVPNYKIELAELTNIKFCDKDFGCIEERECTNLLMVEKIARYCNIVFTLECGATWLFFNSNIDSQINNKFIINGKTYADRINNWYHIASNTKNNVINSVNIEDLPNIISTI